VVVIINVPVLTSYLNIYANLNKTGAELLKEGFLKGFRIGFTRERVSNDAQKLLSARFCIFYGKKSTMSWKLVGLLLHLSFLE
jgi:hypothetical protein